MLIAPGVFAPSIAFVIVVRYVLLPVYGYLRQLYQMYITAKDIPGPSVAHILRHVFNRKISFLRASDVLQETLRQHGPTMKFWSGPVLFVVIMDPRDLEYVLTSRDLGNKSMVYDFLQHFQGNGLLNLSGDVWRKHRKLITPFLHSDLLKDFVEVFDRKARVLVQRIEPLVGTGTHNLYRHVALATSDMICETVLSTNMDTQTNEEREFVEGIDRAMKLLMYRLFRPWFLSDILFTMSRMHGPYNRLVSVFNNFTEKLISRKRMEGVDRLSEVPGKRRTFLDMMLASSKGGTLTDTEIRDETKTLVTVASGGSVDILGFSLLCLSLRQDVQEKCVQELEQIFGSSAEADVDTDRFFTSDDLKQMEYLERVVREVLRMFPSIPLFARNVERDIVLPTGYTVPAGAQLVIYSLNPHRNPEYFPNPHHFDPDRFLSDRIKERHPFAYVPFSAGIRNCIGQRYALMQLKATVARVLRHYKLLPSADGPQSISDIKLNVSVTLSARGGYRMQLERRSTPSEK